VTPHFSLGRGTRAAFRIAIYTLLFLLSISAETEKLPSTNASALCSFDFRTAAWHGGETLLDVSWPLWLALGISRAVRGGLIL